MLFALLARSDPCSFTCTDGHVADPPGASPTACVCGAQNVEDPASGQCVPAPPPPPPTSTPSSPPSSTPPASPSNSPARKRRREREREREPQIVRAKETCAAERMTACGVFGDPRGWECVDTASDLESCACVLSFPPSFSTLLSSAPLVLCSCVLPGGGCMLPFGANWADGTDCTELPGVLDVSCVAGACVVERCHADAGWELSSDDTSRSRCVPAPRYVTYSGSAAGGGGRFRVGISAR